jgi:hypothetical protein
MAEKTKSNLQNAATELATLKHMLIELKNKEDLLQQSFSEYSDKFHVSLVNIPRDPESLNKVLSRFFGDKKIKDIYELVDLHPELINSAMDFTKNPLKGNSRAAYNEAYMTLKMIKNNLDEYNQFRTVNDQATKAHQKATGTLEIIYNNDGFKNYVIERAKLISDVRDDYEALMIYTGSPELNLNDLPKTLDELSNRKLAIAAPSDFGNPDVQIPEAETEPETTEEDGRFEIGGTQYLSLINKSARETATNDITQRKYVCYKEALIIRLEYNDCVVMNQNDSINLDLVCEPKKTRYEISKSNCDTHWPITLSDAVMDSLFNEVEKVHMMIDDGGSYIIDQSTSAKAANKYISVGKILQTGEVLAIEGIGYTNEDQIKPAIKTVTDNVVKILGADMQSIGCGDYCNNNDE